MGRDAMRAASDLRGASELAQAFYSGEIKSLKAAREEFKAYKKSQKDLAFIEGKIDKWSKLRSVSEKLGISLESLGKTLSIAGLAGALFSATKSPSQHLPRNI